MINYSFFCHVDLFFIVAIIIYNDSGKDCKINIV